MTTIEALKSANKICFLVSDHCANVIASGDFCQSDVDNKKTADTFLKWYQSRRLKEDWRTKLQKSMDRLFKTVEQLN